MRLVRVLAVVAVVALLSAGALIDRQQRPVHDRLVNPGTALTVAAGGVTTWFCPGGSGSGGIAELTLELISASPVVRTATVSVLPGFPAAAEDRPVRVAVPPNGRESLEPSRHAPGAAWVGAVVEVDGPDVIVEQVVAADQGGVGRSPCLTRTAERWVVSNGGTRLAVEGERFVLMLLNPFPDFAVADVDLVADVGRDAVEGLVVPARSVLALDVTDEITEAETVTAFVDVVSGRLAVSWIQLLDGPSAGRGARLAPAIPGGAPLWYLPGGSSSGAARRDVVAVANLSRDAVAEVDLEFVADDPGVIVSPIEVTVGPERTALVDLSQEERLEGIGSLTVVIRSLYGVPVAASITSVAPGDSGEGAPLRVVAGTTAMIGADAAARRWLVPVEATDADAEAGFGDDSSAVVVFNPSPVGISVVDVSVGSEVVRSLELGPGGRSRLPVGQLGSGRFVVRLDSSAPIVVGRELVGLTSRTAALGVAVSEPVLATDIR